MQNSFGKQREISVAARAQIIQRVLVDGWSVSEAAHFLGVDERRIALWISGYRRRGMASLHGDLAAESLPRRWGAWLRTAWLRSRVGRLALLMRRGEPRVAEPAICVALRRSGEEPRRR